MVTLATAGALAFPGLAMGQVPEQSDDLPLEEETSVVWNNTIFHTDEGGGYRSDGGSGGEAESAFHSDDQSQFVQAGETVLANTTVTVDMWYDQIADYSFAQASATSDLGQTASITYTRDQENYQVVADSTATGTISSPTVAVPTGYQIVNSLTGP